MGKDWAIDSKTQIKAPYRIIQVELHQRRAVLGWREIRLMER
jgi:hypothetical protein